MEELLPFERVERKVIIRRDASTDPSYGCDPQERPVKDIIQYGIINLNKPEGPTSHQVSEYVQRILGISKAGHSGTLDPKVTGVLPVALGRATRIVQVLLSAGKEYVGVMHLHNEIAFGRVKQMMGKFTGVIRQMPPIKSAVKRRWREREVYYASVLDVEGNDVLFKLGCQAGTYVRKWVHDIGQELGIGAHMASLTRTKAGPFTDRDMVTLQDLEDALWYWKNEGNERFIRYCIRPVESAVAHLPIVWVLDSAIDTLCSGASLKVVGISKLHDGISKGEKVAVMSLKGELVAIGESRMDSKAMLEQGEGVAVKPTKVFMEPGTYPKVLPKKASRPA